MGWDEEYGVSIIKPTSFDQRDKIINILLVNNHYLPIIHLNRLLNSNQQRNYNRTLKYCQRCLRTFATQKKLEEHTPFCLLKKPIRQNMPAKKEFAFNKWIKTGSPPAVFYGDVEALLLSDGTHQPIMSAFLLVPHERTGQCTAFYSFTGLNCIQTMLEKIEELSFQFYWFMQNESTKKMIPLTFQQKHQFVTANNCYLCKLNFGNKIKCRDHDHLTGEYRGPTCQLCNLSLREQRTTYPIVFHNLR